MTRILVVGGAGAFGERITQRLAPTPNVELVIAGRSAEHTRDAAKHLEAATNVKIQTAVIDTCTVTSDLLADIGADIVINASGPFQDHDYTLAEAAITNHSHYIDIADARDYVVGIDLLDQKARDAGVVVISGASSVPGISSTVLCHLSQNLTMIDSVAIGISPGNHFDPGAATTRSVLKGLGQPITTQRDRKPATCYGWQSLKRGRFGELGKRWLSNVDVPDLDLIPQYYPDIKTVTFQAGIELSIQHLGLWGLSWCVRSGILKHPERLAVPLLKLKRLTKSFGSNRGGMFVVVSGCDGTGTQMEKRWTLVARDGHGPFIPALASVILARNLANGKITYTGAQPCFDLVSYQALLDEIADLSITCTIEQAVR